MKELFNYLFICISALFLIGILSLVCLQTITFLDKFTFGPYNLACKDIGFVKYSYTRDFEFCEDKEYNLHYVKVNCNNDWNNICIAKEISVGGVRVV